MNELYLNLPHTHFKKGENYLKKAHDQKSQNLEYSVLLFQKAINDLEIAHEKYPTISKIKEILTKAREDYGEVLKEPNSPGRGHLINENKFFKKDYTPPLNKDDEPSNTQQLACELRRNDISDGQKENLRTLAREIIEEFAKRNSIESKFVHKVMVLSYLPDAEEEIYRNLVNIFITKIKESVFLYPSLLEGLSYVISQANPKHLKPNDLVRILEILNEQFKNLHSQDKYQQIEMTRTLGQLFDVMADCKVRDLKYEVLCKPLNKTFKKLSSDNNQELAYLADYACQALSCIPNDESPWKAFRKVLLGIAKLAGAIKNIDPGKLPDIFKDLSEGFDSIINMAVNLVKAIQSVKEGVGDIKQNFRRKIQREWYWALRFTDLFVQSYKFKSLEQFIYNIPCRQDEKFLWGLCERLKRLAADSKLDTDFREGAIEFLSNVCQNKEFWGVHLKLDEWILEQTTLLNSVLSLDKCVRPTQQNDLKKSRVELSTQLNGLKGQFFSDLDDECEEALELYVKPQGTWKVSIIKSSDSGKEMVSENREGDVEEVVNRFLESKDKLTSNDKETLEVAANELVNRFLDYKEALEVAANELINIFLESKDKLTLNNKETLKVAANELVNRFLESKDKLTSNDKESLEAAANRFLESKDGLTSIGKEVSKAVTNNLNKITNKLLNETIIKTVNSFFALENQLTLEDERVLDKASNKFLDLKVNKVLELEKTITNKFVYSSKYKEDLIMALINILKENPKIIEDVDVEFLKIEANKCLNLNDKNVFESAVNKHLASKARKILETTVNKMVASKCKKVLMILGIGGTGKSTFGRYLASRLWDEYDHLSPIPLFIPLARLKYGMFNKNEDFIELYLKECKLSLDKIEDLRKRKFVFILDGYDEIVERERECYFQNKFCGWINAKIIISCRPEYLGLGYQKRFFPVNKEKGFQELTIKAFSEKEVKQYITKYVQKEGNLSEDIYLQQIKKIPEELVSNPILLKITLNVLPRFIEQERTEQINRIALYDEFLKTWFDRAQDRLYRTGKTEKEEEAFKNLNINDFSESCLQFSKNFAVEMFKDNNNVVITYNSYYSKWATFLADDDIKNSLLRFSLPLIRRENQYWFFHKTLRDHLIARAFLESLESPLHATQSSQHAALFKEQSFVLEHGVRQFLVEHISQMESLKPKLVAFIEASKKDDGIQIASANAITILTQADVLLNNLNDANISGADLSNKIFNNLQAERAKLNNVNFQNAKFKDANLRSASFQNARLQDADLQSSSLQGANFQNANLQNANLQSAVLSFADLRDTILQYTNFENAKLQNTNVRGLSLQNTYFEGADLSFADLQNTILQDVNFRNVKLRNASLQNAYIKDTDLIFADLQNTVLVDINFQELSIKNLMLKISNAEIKSIFI
ncbi:24003_t:CDS:2 [Cetraspora pellucida]|uniref:24003_t:CDS:1 n=1 Tax=Cetraspora pellucida TaxID=1433469 RepID=A0A9N9CM22_9GLOM|nr:24003_t:CDS:2 [Cetraspora pellucida]